jgi:hypothetical protein
MHPTLILALFTGVGIAAACGLRAFLPLFVVGILSRAHVLQLHPGAEWLAGNSALVALGVATLLEILADKIPVVDHALDLVATGLRPLAAVLGAYAVLVQWPTPWAQLLALALGGGALLLHAARAKLRLGSTLLTAGHANPLLSLADDAGALVMIALALFAPALVLLAILGLGFALFRARRALPQ